MVLYGGEAGLEQRAGPVIGGSLCGLSLDSQMDYRMGGK